MRVFKIPFFSRILEIKEEQLKIEAKKLKLLKEIKKLLSMNLGNLSRNL